MKIVRSISALGKALEDLRIEGRRVGLVPTMGALHRGHLSLVEEALSRKDAVVVTIFVNPTQFNDPGDLERYPRNLKQDQAMLREYPVSIVFTPSVEEMYPEKDTRIFDLAPLDSVMEGIHRPGHFNGVAQIVSKLFEITSPDRAYFGLKDFQQVAVIKKLVSLMNLPLEIVGCPIVREKDGLAMSSRNLLLTRSGREAAPHINHVLEEAAKVFRKYKPPELTKWVTDQLNLHPLINVEYFEIVDDETLQPAINWHDSQRVIGCIAARIENVRLIDNRYFT